MSSMWGNNVRISIFGESHGAGIGVNIDGIPGGFPISEDSLCQFLARRAPRSDGTSTMRKESDLPQILSGIYHGITCGTPIAAIIQNQNTMSGDYADLADLPRPGHADYTGMVRYHGANDPRGGGHFSGRLTAPLVFAGGICKQLLSGEGVEIGAHIASVHGIKDQLFHPVEVSPSDFHSIWERSFPVLDPQAEEPMRKEILRARENLDSVGGIIECAVTGLPAGIGSPMFDGMENAISSIVFGIPAVKGIEFGNGFSSADLFGSENNDEFRYEEGAVKTASNRHGGILGGITSGMPLLFKVAIKPTPSIAKQQNTISLNRKENAGLEIHGRHDPCIVPRAVPCIEAAAAIAVLDRMISEGKFPPMPAGMTNHN